MDRAPRWSLKKLTATYLTLGLADIGRAVKIDSEDDVRNLILSMVITTTLHLYLVPILTNLGVFV